MFSLPHRRACLSGVLMACAGLVAPDFSTAASTGQSAETQRQEIEAVIHDTAARWNSQDYASVLELWDPDEPMPMYLAEEQKDWFIGPRQVRAYLSASPSFIEAIRERMSNIRVQPLSPDLAAAVWDLHFEMKTRGSAPIGEDIRVTAIFRRKPEGWRYVHYAEAPMTAPMYMRKLMQQDVEPEFQDVYREALKKKAPNPSSPSPAAPQPAATN